MGFGAITPIELQGEDSNVVTNKFLPPGAGLLSGYDSGAFFCELTSGRGPGQEDVDAIAGRLHLQDLAHLRHRSALAVSELFDLGVTFTVYSNKDAIDRILPFDVIPRVITAAEWSRLEAGVIQRVTAINLFLHDVYHDQRILADKVVPESLVLGNANYRPVMRYRDVPRGAYAHVCGIDLVRDQAGEFHVLEDNARTPSGVSYVVENRALMLRAFPDLMADTRIRPVDNYGLMLRQALDDIAPQGVDEPRVVLLSPGIYNSAFFEHVFLAREMGVPLVEGRDLLIDEDRVYMRTTAGRAPVHSIYRRIDDAFLDPKAFNPDSLLGVPGLMEVYRKGNVALANAPGTGVADDKAVYSYMPRIIKYYLGEEAVIPNVETFICREPDGLAYTLANLEHLVVKPVGESGGYGMIIGPKATKAEIEEFRVKLKADPTNYISQPVVGLSVCPTLTDTGIQPRHVDLRPYAVTGAKTTVLPGGLSRVALKEGSLVVNSSQGGGSKDTWVLE
ncbi:MAG: circularly permuted type 2 ATP-grasp protein [Alphaproteobacteria bacterium]|nr:circularly permuted type 2 ATP-grasp protein [Alphaproteobacteria bacterium]